MDHSIDFILASASPRRRELLKTLGLDFKIIPADIDETQRPGELPLDYVQRVAREKAENVCALRPRSIGSGMWVLSADTIVEIDNTVLGKPSHSDDACKMLQTLSGRTHKVHTAVTLITEKCGVHHAVETTSVFFLPISMGEISSYIARGEWRDKAGAYAIQGAAQLFVEKIEGCFYNVVGLPVSLCSRMMAQCGWTLKMQLESEGIKND